jgi:hypothetical protein
MQFPDTKLSSTVADSAMKPAPYLPFRPALRTLSDIAFAPNSSRFHLLKRIANQEPNRDTVKDRASFLALILAATFACNTKDKAPDVTSNVRQGLSDVPSESRRSSAEKLAKDVPNVKQVVNELEVKNRKATSTQ